MKFLTALITLSLVLSGFAANAKVVRVFCRPNVTARISQFAGLAVLEVGNDNSVKGTFEFATQVSHSAESSALKTIKVSGTMNVVPPGVITSHEVLSFELKSEQGQEMYLHLNSGMPVMPQSSTILVDRANKFSAECSVH